MSGRVAAMRERWNQFAVRFTETANKRMTLQCSRELHSHMQLDSAHSVLEVAAGAGLAALDIVKYLSSERSVLPADSKRSLTVTDLAPAMVGLAKQNLRDVASEQLEVQCQEANGQDLVGIAAGSMDRYVSGMCLHIAPDPDAMLREARRVLTADGIAGFTIWGAAERSGKFAINSAANRELGLEENKGEKGNFAMGKDLPALREKFAKAGFSRVQIWPFQCVVELWSAEDFAKFHQESFPLEDEGLSTRRFAVVERLAAEWLAKGTPIGLESYLILARP